MEAPLPTERRDYRASPLRRALGVVWFEQPQSARVRVSVSRRDEIRARTSRARQFLDAARASEAGDVQNLLAAEALRTLLAAVACADEAFPLDSAVAVRAGMERVRSTIADPGQVALLAAYGDPERPIPKDRLTFPRVVDLCAWTASLIDNSSTREIQLFRLLAWLALAAVLALVALAIFGSRNLALGKTVTASSVCGSTPEAPRGAQRLARVVDGVTAEGRISRAEWMHGTYAMCTEAQIHPWVTVDLAVIRTIDEVVVYNRSDCCWGTDDLPVAVQISQDNQHFETVATRTDPFTDYLPWRVSVGPKQGRYVRLFNSGDGSKNIVLNEIEVYGH